MAAALQQAYWCWSRPNIPSHTHTAVTSHLWHKPRTVDLPVMVDLLDDGHLPVVPSKAASLWGNGRRSGRQAGTDHVRPPQLFKTTPHRQPAPLAAGAHHPACIQPWISARRGPDRCTLAWHHPSTGGPVTNRVPCAASSNDCSLPSRRPYQVHGACDPPTLILGTTLMICIM